MRSRLHKIFTCGAVVIALFGMPNTLTAKTKKIVSSTGAKLKTLTLQVSDEDLYLSKGNILLVDIEGIPHAVTSLTRSGNQWIAQLSPWGNCSWGHPLCRHCGMCHERICPIRQPRTSKCQ
jgi:hypothetical protein